MLDIDLIMSPGDQSRQTEELALGRWLAGERIEEGRSLFMMEEEERG